MPAVNLISVALILARLDGCSVARRRIVLIEHAAGFAVERVLRVVVPMKVS
jgi:hypothetical protein